MRYLILIYSNEQQFMSLTPEAGASMMGEYRSYMGELEAAGVMKGGHQLQPTFTATTIRTRDGKTQNTDGPFAETKEQLGGFFMIDVDTLDEAIAWGAKCPGTRHGCVEVRPIVTTSMPAKEQQANALAGR